MDRSRYPVRVTPLDAQGQDHDYAELTPDQRVAMVWTLTLQAWMFKEGRLDEPEFRRDVVRVIRNRD